MQGVSGLQQQLDMPGGVGNHKGVVLVADMTHNQLLVSLLLFQGKFSVRAGECAGLCSGPIHGDPFQRLAFAILQLFLYNPFQVLGGGDGVHNAARQCNNDYYFFEKFMIHKTLLNLMLK